MTYKLHQEEERLDDDHVLAHGTVDFIGLFKDGSICFKMATRFTIIYKWTNGNGWFSICISQHQIWNRWTVKSSLSHGKTGEENSAGRFMH